MHFIELRIVIYAHWNKVASDYFIILLFLKFMIEMASIKTYNATESIEQLLFIKIKQGEFGGYKQDWLINNLSELEIEFYICMRCNGVMRSACQIGEEQMLVCEACAPLDHKPQPLAKSRKKIFELRAKCPLEGRGCEWNGTIAEIYAHLYSECSELIMRCVKRCGVIMGRAKLSNHYINECQNRIISCEHCRIKIQYKMLENHYSTCIELPLLCPNECLRNLIRNEIESHIQNECPNTLFNCENKCGLKIKRSGKQNHCKNECPNRKIHCKHCSVIILYKEITTHNEICHEFPLLCPLGCLKVIFRKELKSHIENDCHNTLVECPYKKMGCEDVMKRCEKMEHEKISESKHLKNVVIYFSNEMEQMKSTFKLEIKALKSENEKLKTNGQKMADEIKDLAEQLSYPIVLRNQIGEVIMRPILDRRASFFKETLTDKNEFWWNQNAFFLQFKYKRDQALIIANVTTVSIKRPSLRVKFKIKFLDMQNAYNSCVFESTESPLSKGTFHLAEFHEDLLLEERLRNIHESVSFTLQVQEINDFW